MTIEFDDSLITKNELIDTQHQELISRIKQFVESCGESGDKLKAIKMLDYLADYTDFHFSAEEELQKNINYPGFEQHHAKHEEFKNSLNTLREFLEESEGPTEAFVEQIKKTVVDWLFNHIKSFDRSVAEYIFMSENPERL